ncbi:uncharacterized protein LOC120115979 [Hibiscus syriacus]|uniref:uncharacterized protein LOC120115979 n=1 Tax=Hibiscus syriacus TaxID=106335 RepID=UPI0019211746|nr:uncharacterized protein LOC120115979 [Hibiscus syriacus]
MEFEYSKAWGLEHDFRGLSWWCPSPPSPTVVWSHPPPNRVKINTDAGHSLVLQKATSGVVIRDEHDHVLGSFYQSHSSLSSVFMEDALAAFHGHLFAKGLGFSLVILKSESESIISKLQSNVDDSSVIRSTIWDILCLSKSFAECLYRYTHRERNRATHEMTKEGVG